MGNYLLPKYFVFFTDHKALQYINNQGKMNQNNTKWVEFLQSYHFVLKHRCGKYNKVIGALSQRTTLLNTMPAVEVVSLN